MKNCKMKMAGKMKMSDKKPMTKKVMVKTTKK
jgi:hypothetical protein